MAEQRRMILSDPLATKRGPARFVVAGQGPPGGSGDVKLYEWDGEAERMSMIGCHTDISGIKAIAWSPIPSNRSIMALGLSTGRTQIVSLSSSTLSLPIGGGTTPSPSTVLTVKHSRPVTALAFSTRDPYLLATGYDRHRSDYSLLIWDVSECVAALPKSRSGDTNWMRPSERIEITNPMANRSTIGSTTPSMAGHKNEASASHPRHLQQYCPSEAVQSVAWIPRSSTELLASSNNKVLRLYDLRAPGASASVPSTRDPQTAQLAGAAVQWASRAVYMITPDPDRQYRFASVESTASGGIVRLWDTRRPGTEQLSFDTGDGSVVTLDWMSNPPGTPYTGCATLGVGTREGGVSVWDIVSGSPREDGVDDWVSIGGMRKVVRPKQNLQSFAFAPPISPSLRDVLFIVKDGTVGAGPVGAAPIIASSARGELAVGLASLQVLDPDAVARTPGLRTPGTRSRAPSQPQSRDPGPASDDARRKNRFQLAPERVAQLLAAERARSRDGSPSRLGRLRKDDDLIEEEGMEEEDRHEEITNAEGVRRALRHDAPYIMRRRVEDGYGLDNLLLNAAVATRYTDSERLSGIWEFVDHFVQATVPGLSCEAGYDLTFQGIWPIWTGILGAENAKKVAPNQPTSGAWAALRAQREALPDVSHHSTPRRDAADIQDPDYTAAIGKLNTLRAESGSIGAPGKHRLPHTEKAPQRRMILAVCGENHAYETMDEVNRLVDDDQRTKAACWAFFAGEEGPAVTILMRSDDEKHRLMGATIAGFMSQSRAERGSLFWQEHWRTMVTKVDDPYIRAVLTRIAGEDWDGILYDESLPLLDRVAVAVCNLSDKEFTGFLRNRMTRCIQLGSLAGLALSGFTSTGLSLLQRFVDRTNDVQTAALLSAFFPHNRLTKKEVHTLEQWQESYRSLLDSWMAWVPRCQFDVGLIACRRDLEEEPADNIQTVVVCPVCNAQLTKQTDEMLRRKNAIRGGGAYRAPTVRTTQCSYCQNTLPRCSVCLLHVQPETDSRWHDGGDSMDAAYVSCQTCRHGGHAAHIMGWFEGGLDGEPAHDVCPVSTCNCHCASL